MKKKSTLKIIAGIIIIAIILAGLWFALRMIEKSMQDDSGKSDSTQHSMFIDLVIDDEFYETNHYVESYLFIGTDENGSDADSEEGYRGGLADFLLLAVIDRTTNKFAFIQIDRDTMMEIDMIDQNGNLYMSSIQQICTANWYGKDETQSAENTRNMVSELLGGLPIDGYYSVGVKDIGRLNSAVGGVTITIPEDLTEIDPAMKAGTTLKLTDRQAELFLRTRMTVGDGTNPERMSRQRVYLNALYRDSMTSAKSNPSFIDNIFNELSDIAVTDMNAKTLSRLANQISKSERISGSDEAGVVTIDGELTEGIHLDDGLVHAEFYHDPKSIVSLLEELIGLKEFSNE